MNRPATADHPRPAPDATRQRDRRAWWPIRAAALVAALGVAAATTVVALVDRTSSPKPSAVTPVEGTAFRRAHEGLCAALDHLASGDVAAAERAFQSRAHDPVHELAERAAGEDRSVAARLLEAKAAVETSLAAGGASAVEDLRRLAAATAKATELVTGQRPANCT